MSKFAPTALLALVLIAWIINTSRHAKRAEELDEQIEKLSPEFVSNSEADGQAHRSSSASQPGIPDLEAVEKVRSAIQALLDEAEKSTDHEQLRFQIQTATQALSLAQNLTTSEFISLVGQLSFPGGPGMITRLVMARIALREAPTLLLTAPPGDLWKESHFRQVAFPKLLETDPELSRKWFMENKAVLSDLSRDLFRRDLLRHDLKTNPAAALESMTDDELRYPSRYFKIKDPASREALAKALLKKFPEASDQKTNFAGCLLKSVLESNDGDPNEMIRHLNTFFPDDPEGLYRIKALHRSGPFVLGDHFSSERIEKVLKVARSISSESEHQMIRGLVERWAGSNLDEAGSWLDTLPSSSLRDSAVAGFIGKVAKANPQVALEWAATISDENTAGEQRTSILESWRKKDPDSARAWQSKNE